MYSVVSCAIVHGIDSLLVRAETDLSSGLPVFEMVGFLSSEVKEARERVRTAMNNCGYALPIKRITVNLSPAHIRKSGSGFDLPVAVSILAAMGVIAKRDLSDIVMVGELGLNGQIYPVSGVLPMILAAADCKKRVCLVPVDNYAESALVPQMTVVAVRDLADRLEIRSEEIMTLGDGDNDRPMLQNAGLGVAMGNAPDFVKITADLITLDNEHDGAAAAIRQVLEEA